MQTIPNRVWTDTDAACGTGPRVDPDDCLAFQALIEDSRINVVGVSTGMGNATAQCANGAKVRLCETHNLLVPRSTHGRPTEHHPMTDDRIDQRLTDLEIKASFAEDLVDHLNALVARQQDQIDLLMRELAALRQQSPADEPGASRNLRDDLPPHY